ncbi:MAG: hypothetical protein WBF13_01465 [Candidatus Zixiibacteriota bacterium]
MIHKDARVVCCGPCYFGTATTIYRVSGGVYVVRVFDTAGDCVGKVEVELPPA